MARMSGNAEQNSTEQSGNPSGAEALEVTSGNASKEGAQAVNGNGKKDSTSELPMLDLEEIVRFVSSIHEKGLETSKMPDVAAGCGYKHASSTPFYRRLSAARLFGLLATSGAELTVRARDYMKPTKEGADRQALRDAVMNVPYYSDVVQKHLGKRLNCSLISNEIERAFNLTESCARSCSKVLEASLRTAGILSSDNSVLLSENPASNDQKNISENASDEEVGETEETQRHTLFLDKQKHRKFTINAPLTITAAELQRITSWLSFTIIVEGSIPAKTDEAKIS